VTLNLEEFPVVTYHMINAFTNFQEFHAICSHVMTALIGV